MKFLQALRKVLSGENKAGQILHGALDLLPIPNQIIAKLFKSGKVGLREALTVRNIAALLLTIAIACGWISLEQVKQLIEIFASVASAIGEVL